VSDTLETKGHRTQARLLDAASGRFGATGFRSTSVAAIARDAGVSPATAFAYWNTKEALFEAALDHDARAVIDDLLASMTSGEVSPGAIALVDDPVWLGLVDNLLRVLEDHPLARRVLAGEEPDFVDGLLEAAAFDDLRALLASAITSDQGIGRSRSDLDPLRAAVGIETITIALVMTMLRLKRPPSDERRAGVGEILLAAFRPPS
jgi:AcrR family transcriptional regulator